MNISEHITKLRELITCLDEAYASEAKCFCLTKFDSLRIERKSKSNYECHVKCSSSTKVFHTSPRYLVTSAMMETFSKMELQSIPSFLEPRINSQSFLWTIVELCLKHPGNVDVLSQIVSLINDIVFHFSPMVQSIKQSKSITTMMEKWFTDEKFEMDSSIFIGDISIYTFDEELIESIGQTIKIARSLTAKAKEQQ